MSTISHTPGPWRIAKEINNEGTWIECTHAESGENDEICHCTATTISESERDANARLIVMSPALLKIAEAYRNLLRTMAHTEGEVRTFEHIEATIAAATEG